MNSGLENPATPYNLFARLTNTKGRTTASLFAVKLSNTAALLTVACEFSGEWSIVSPINGLLRSSDVIVNCSAASAFQVSSHVVFTSSLSSDRPPRALQPCIRHQASLPLTSNCGPSYPGGMTEVALAKVTVPSRSSYVSQRCGRTRLTSHHPSPTLLWR